MICTAPVQKTMSTSEFHYLAGKFIREREKLLGVEQSCCLRVEPLQRQRAIGAQGAQQRRGVEPFGGAPLGPTPKP